MDSRRPNIWKLQATKDVDGLIEALGHTDPDIRKAAGVALRVIGEAKAIPALKLALVRERHTDVRDHLTATIEHLDQSSASSDARTRSRENLVTRLSSPDAETIIQAAQALGELGDQLATEALVMVFRNPLQRDDVRLAAAQALLKLKSAPAVVTLLAGLEKENWRIRHNSATVLGQVKASWATEPLVKLLQDEHPNVRLAAASALSRLQTPRAQEALEVYKAQRSGQTRPLPMAMFPPPTTPPAPGTLPETPSVKPAETPTAPPALQTKDVGTADPIADTITMRPLRLEGLKPGQPPVPSDPKPTDTPPSEALPPPPLKDKPTP